MKTNGDKTVRKRVARKLARNQFIAAALWEVALWSTVLFVAFVLIGYAKADCVVAFYSPACGPCMQQKPTEEKLIAEGCDIRLVNVQEKPALARAYRVSRIPCVVYVAERPLANYDCGRLVGLQSEETLRKFCQPRVLLYNTQPVLNTVRWVMGFPVILGY